MAAIFLNPASSRCTHFMPPVMELGRRRFALDPALTALLSESIGIKRFTVNPVVTAGFLKDHRWLALNRSVRACPVKLEPLLMPQYDPGGRRFRKKWLWPINQEHAGRHVSNSWIISIIWLYIALKRTPNIDCYWVGAVPKL